MKVHALAPWRFAVKAKLFAATVLVAFVSIVTVTGCKKEEPAPEAAPTEAAPAPAAEPAATTTAQAATPAAQAAPAGETGGETAGK
jgi:hypothetical protein